MDYKDKYIKYKTKYLELKNIDINNQIDGGKNIIICESFSKCYGLSGIRLGFICSYNEEFNEELIPIFSSAFSSNGLTVSPKDF